MEHYEKLMEVLPSLGKEEWAILFDELLNKWATENLVSYYLRMGGIIFLGTFLIFSLLSLIYETANEKWYRRNRLKFIETDDISTLIYYLKQNYPAETIGKFIINAYEKDKEIKRIIIESRQKRKEGWKKLWKRLKDKEQ